MAKKLMIAKNKHLAKHLTQAYACCERCRYSHSVYRKFHLCCICFYEPAYEG